MIVIALGIEQVEGREGEVARDDIETFGHDLLRVMHSSGTTVPALASRRQIRV